MNAVGSLVCRAVSALAVMAALVACGGTAPLQQGTALDATVARMGEPRARYALESGNRLFYSVRPGEMDRLDFDVGGHLVERQRALSQERFAALAKRGGDAAAVQLEFGPPARKSVMEDGGGLQWTYSWLEYDVWRLAQIWFDKAGIFQRVEVSEDPLADDRYR